MSFSLLSSSTSTSTLFTNYTRKRIFNCELVWVNVGGLNDGLGGGLADGIGVNDEYNELFVNAINHLEFYDFFFFLLLLLCHRLILYAFLLIFFSFFPFMDVNFSSCILNLLEKKLLFCIPI